MIFYIRSVERSEIILRRCSVLFHQNLRDDLAEILAALPKVLTFAIDRLVLDVGTLSYLNWETELRQRLIMQLGRQLREAGASTLDVYPRAEQRLSTVRAGGMAREADDKQFFDRLVLDALHRRTVSDRAWLARLCLDPVMLQRLQKTFRSDTLQSIAHALSGGDQTPTLNDALARNMPQARRGITAWTREQAAEALTHNAESFFQYHPEQRVPKIQAGGTAREADDTQAFDQWVLDALRRRTVSDRAWLARLCLNSGMVKRLQQRFDSDTLQRIVHTLNPSALSNVLEANPPQAHHSTPALTSERFTEALLHSAESFFQHHPEQRVPRGQAGGMAREANDKQAFNQWVLGALLRRTVSDRAWLARLCLNPGMVKRLQQMLDSDTLQRIAHTLSGDEYTPTLNDALILNTPQAHRSTTAWTRERVTEVLLHSAESFFQRYPEQRSAAPMDNWPMGSRKTALLSRPGPLAAQQPLPASQPDPSIDKPLPISGAGLVLLWPLLPTVLRRLGLVTEKIFIDEAAQYGAVNWLDRLVWGGDAVFESRALFNKALCALPLDAPLPEAPLETERLVELNAWLDGLPMSLPGLQRCGVPDIRQLFLQRTGYLTQRAGQWTVHVDTDASDVLLRDICWPMQAVLLPWLEKPIVIDWALTDNAYR